MHNLDAFIPFSYGPANCAGRLLAIQEMRFVASLLCSSFDIRLKPGMEDWDVGLLDHFVMAKDPLEVIICRREGVTVNTILQTLACGP